MFFDVQESLHWPFPVNVLENSVISFSIGHVLHLVLLHFFASCSLVDSVSSALTSTLCRLQGWRYAIIGGSGHAVFVVSERCKIVRCFLGICPTGSRGYK